MGKEVCFKKKCVYREWIGGNIYFCPFPKCPFEKNRVQVNYCDICGSEGAKYCLDGDDVCEECAETIIMDAFKELMLSERAKAVGIDLEKI